MTARLQVTGHIDFLKKIDHSLDSNQSTFDLPLPKYIWTLLKNTNKTERLSCLAAMVALAVCITLIIFYTVYGKNKEEPVLDTAPHEWKISRDMWLAQEHLENSLPDEFKPVKLVVVQHTAGSECYTFDTCATELRNLQGYFLTNLRYDIPYTFLIGNDGRVYEGRGWNQEGAHTYGYNRCSVGIGFMGDYRGEMAVHTKVTPKQIQNMMQILQEGVNKGYIVPDYSIVAALDLRPTKSPGSIIYKALQQLDHFDNGTQFANRNCSQIHGYIK